MSESLPTIIIGAGVVGAAMAYSLRKLREPVYLLEAESRPGTGISSRNSGVIHAGLYYPTNSLKTRLCRRGAAMLYQFAQTHAIPHLKTGKYIVANNDQELDHLTWLAHHAHDVPLHPVDQLPQHVRAKRALFSPHTGIIDIHPFIQTLLDQSSAEILYNQKVTELALAEGGVSLTVNGESYQAARVINCAGLNATHFLADAQHYLARGNYFRLKLPTPIDPPFLVYPAVPKGSAGLGIHLTRNMAGEAYLGPDVQWVTREDYSVDETRRLDFFEAASTYLPWLEPHMLQPGYAGIRPKLNRHQFSDFQIRSEGPQAALIHCLGIESPGITAAMAIAEYITENLLQSHTSCHS